MSSNVGSNALSRTSIAILFADQELIFDAAGGLYWPTQELLVVSDLHLEKGSFYAQKGNPLPLYDTRETLSQLARLIKRYRPKKILTLGDNIHDEQAFTRMEQENHAYLYSLFDQVECWIWIMGNHDKTTLPNKVSNMHFDSHITLENITFSHDFLPQFPFQIVGHYHPKIRIKNISGKCFLLHEKKIIVPSLGCYTGGFLIDSPEFRTLTEDETFKAFFLNREKIWRVR